MININIYRFVSHVRPSSHSQRYLLALSLSRPAKKKKRVDVRETCTVYARGLDQTEGKSMQQIFWQKQQILQQEGFPAMQGVFSVEMSIYLFNKIFDLMGPVYVSGEENALAFFGIFLSNISTESVFQRKWVFKYSDPPQKNSNDAFPQQPLTHALKRQGIFVDKNLIMTNGHCKSIEQCWRLIYYSTRGEISPINAL